MNKTTMLPQIIDDIYSQKMMYQILIKLHKAGRDNAFNRV